MLQKGQLLDNVENKLPVLEDVRQISDGWLKKYILTYRMPDGSPYEYEAVSRKGLGQYMSELENRSASTTKQHRSDAICIVPILPDGSVLLIREFRYAINDWIIAFPAGLMEPGEDIATCIERELFEETGYKLSGSAKGAISVMPQASYSSIGMSNESVLITRALVEPSGDQHLENSEFIELFTLAPDEIDDFLDSNKAPIGTRCQLVLECMRKNRMF